MPARKLWIAVLVVVVVVGLGWMIGRGRGDKETMEATADGGAAASVPPAPGSTATPARTPPPAPAPPAAAPKALDRDLEVRTKIDAVLDRYPDVATLKSLECQPTGACTIVIHVDDLHNFRAPLELLQDPESGLSGDHALMILNQPVAQGPNGTAPYLFTFQLTPPEGGVVTPSSPPRPTP